MFASCLHCQNKFIAPHCYKVLIPMKSNLLTQSWKYIATGCSTPITSFLGLGTADSSLNNSSRLKIHQNAVFYILTRTWIHWLNSQAKNHETSSFTQKINASRLLALCFFSLRIVKNYPLFSGLKTPQSNQQPLVNNKLFKTTQNCTLNSLFSD